MTVVMAGFVDFEITWRADVYDGAPQESNAANFGTQGINFRARKPATEEEWLVALEELSCEIPQGLSPKSVFGATLFYDAGDTGCAFGPLDDIAATLRKMESGQTLEVRATDTAVSVDLPTWVRLSGHSLVAQQDDRYLILRK